MLLVKWRGIGHFNIQIRTALCTAELQASPDTSSVTDTRTTCRHKNRVPSKKPLYTYIFIQSIVCMAMISWVFQDTSNRVSLKLFTTWGPSRLDNDPISCYRTLNGSFFRGEPVVQGILKKTASTHLQNAWNSRCRQVCSDSLFSLRGCLQIGKTIS